MLNIRFKMKPLIFAVAVACGVICLHNSAYANDKDNPSPTDFTNGERRTSTLTGNPLTGNITQYNVTNMNALPKQAILPIVVNNALSNNLGAKQETLTENLSLSKDTDNQSHGSIKTTLTQLNLVSEQSVEYPKNGVTPSQGQVGAVAVSTG